MSSAESFIDLLEKKDLLPPVVLRSLREHIRDAPKPLDAAAIAHLLIKQGHLTASMAERLLASQGKPKEAAPSPAKPSSDKPAKPLSDKPAKPAASIPAGKPGAKPAPGVSLPPLASLDSLLNEELPPLPGQGGVPLDALMAADMPLPAAKPKRLTLRRLIAYWLRRMRGSSIELESPDPRQVKMVLWSWGGAVTLLVFVFGLFWALSPPGPSEMLRHASDAYEAGDYAKAVKDYDRYLEAYPYLQEAIQARVRRGLARLREAAQEAKQSGAWSPAFDVAQEIMRTLPSEPAFENESAEIGVALAVIGEGLADEGSARPDPKMAEQVRRIVALIETNVSEDSRPGEMLAAIKRKLRQNEQQATSDQGLADALTAIQQSLAKGDAVTACTVRNKLVKQYPELAQDAKLKEALSAVPAILQAAVTTVEKSRPALTGERPSGVLAVATLAQRTVKGEVPDGRGRFLFVSTAGSAFALDAASGKVLWRRFVALPKDEGSDIPPPLPLSQEPGSDVILTDPVSKELLRVEGTTGRLLWRHVLEQPAVAEPIRVGNRLLTPVEGGQLLIIDLLTGNATGCVQLPQPVRMTPVLDSLRALLFVVADSSNMYVLSSANQKCLQVLHLGHELSTIAAQPVIAENFLVVAVNDTPKESMLNLFSMGPANAGQTFVPLKLVQQVRVKGHIQAPPMVRSRRLMVVMVVTLQGGLQLFDLDRDRATAPLKSIMHSDLAGEETRVRYPMMRGNRCWVADTQLARYEVSAAGARLVPRRISDRGFTFLQSLTMIGPTLVHVRQKPGMPGVTVSAVDMETHEPVWQTWIGAPLAHEPLADPTGRKLMAVTSLGGLFADSVAAFQGRGVADEPLLAVDAAKLLQPVRDVTTLSGGMFVMTSGPGSQQIILYDPLVAEKEQRYRYLWVPSATACTPLGLGDGILTPCRDGQVFLLDTVSARNLAPPFLPPVKSVTVWKWTQPDLAGQNEAVLSDGDKRIYLVHLKKQGDAVRLEAEETLSAKAIVSRVAVTGNVAYMVAADDSAVAFELPKMTPGKSQPLGGSCVWGPRRVGTHVLLATDKNRLFCFDDRQQLVWEKDLPDGPLAGTPLLDGDHYLLASRSGVIARVAAATGEPVARVNVDRPIRTGAVLLDKRLFVGGHDGSLFEVKRP